MQKEKAVETIESVCQRESVETLTIFGLTEQVSDIIEVIENKGIAVDGNTVTDSTNEKELLNVKNALLAVGTDTKLSFLNKAISVCKDYGINILGCVFITEK